MTGPWHSPHSIARRLSQLTVRHWRIHVRAGPRLSGLGKEHRVDAYWAGYANATAIRELDFNDSFFAEDSSHPGDIIGPLAAIAEQRGLTGTDLLRGIVTGYEVQVNLVKGIALNKHRVDHVAHLGPAVAAGIGAMLKLAGAGSLSSDQSCRTSFDLDPADPKGPDFVLQGKRAGPYRTDRDAGR